MAQRRQRGNPNPVGTLEDLRKSGLDPKVYGSCSQPIQSENIGCRFYPTCVFTDEKHGNHRGVDGPVNKGARIIKVDGSIREVCLSCTGYMGLHTKFNNPDIADPNMLEVIAKEGDTIHVMETEPRMEAGNVIPTHKSVTKEFKVPPHGDRIGVSDQLASESYAAQARARMRVEQKAETRRQRLGIPEPLPEVVAPGASGGKH